MKQKKQLVINPADGSLGIVPCDAPFDTITLINKIKINKMSVFENTIKRLQNIAPEISFKNALMLAEEAEKHSEELSYSAYVILNLLELIGISDNGYLPEWILKKASASEPHTWAIMQAGKFHGGHSCGIPGYEQSMRDYYQMFLHHKFTLSGDIKRNQQEWAKLLNSEQNAQECDATKDDQGTKAGKQNTNSLS